MSEAKPPGEDEHEAGSARRELVERISAPLRRQRLELPGERARSRVSAYVYGNVLVLGSVLTASPHAVGSGTAPLAVAATTLTTYAAHVLAHDVSHRIEASDDERRERVRDELADATPIIVSGVTPVLVLTLAALGVLPTGLALAVSAGVLVIRLAIIGWRIEALSGAPAGLRSALEGVALALAGGLIALAKSAFHF